MPVENIQTANVQPSVQRRHGRPSAQRCAWEVEIVRMEVNNVKLVGHLYDLLELDDVEYVRIQLVAQSKGLRNSANEISPRPAVARSEKCYIVTLLYQLFSKIGNYAFRPAIQLGWNRLVQW